LETRTSGLKYIGNICPQPRSGYAGITGCSDIVESPTIKIVTAGALAEVGGPLGCLGARAAQPASHTTAIKADMWMLPGLNTDGVRKRRFMNRQDKAPLHFD